MKKGTEDREKKEICGKPPMAMHRQSAMWRGVFEDYCRDYGSSFGSTRAGPRLERSSIAKFERKKQQESSNKRGGWLSKRASIVKWKRGLKEIVAAKTGFKNQGASLCPKETGW